MEKDLSRRRFLERVGLGTAAGVSLSILNELGEARPVAANPLPIRTPFSPNRLVKQRNVVDIPSATRDLFFVSNQKNRNALLR